MPSVFCLSHLPLLPCIQNPDLKTVLDLTEQWNMLNKDTGSMLVTGVTLVRSDFLRENRSPVADFIKDHEASTLFTTEHPDAAAELIASQGIVEKAPHCPESPSLLQYRMSDRAGDERCIERLPLHLK